MTYRYQKVVQFSETDMAGITHFANFAKWAEEAEHTWLRELGIPVIDSNGGWPRVHFSIDFKAPVRMGETILVVLDIEKLGGSSIAYNFVINSASSEVVYATGKMVTVYVGMDGKPQEIPNDWKEKLA